MAKNNGPELLRTAEISAGANIPRKFLELILLDLKRASFVQSVRGSKGGFSLGKDPGSIYLVDILRLFDGPVALVPCVSMNFYQPCRDCPDEGTCAINWAMAKIRDKTLSAMKGITIRQLAAHQTFPEE